MEHHGLRRPLTGEHGDDIVIEERPATEITTIGERAYAPAGVGAFNPVFDVTPAALIDVLVTDRGVLQQPDRAGLQRLLGGTGPALMEA